MSDNRDKPSVALVTKLVTEPGQEHLINHKWLIKCVRILLVVAHDEFLPFVPS